MATLVTIFALWLLGWLGVAIVMWGIFHICLSPRRMQKRWLERFPPLPSGSIDRDDRSFQ